MNNPRFTPEANLALATLLQELDADNLGGHEITENIGNYPIGLLLKLSRITGVHIVQYRIGTYGPWMPLFTNPDRDAAEAGMAKLRLFLLAYSVE